MGMTRSVAVGSRPLSWAKLRQQLTPAGVEISLKMIDGQLALPGEVPNEEWKELRVSSLAGMVTLRREGSEIHCIVWGNADANLLDLRDRLAEAISRCFG